MNKSRRPFFVFFILTVVISSALVWIAGAVIWNNVTLKQAEDGKLVELSGTAAYNEAASHFDVSLPPLSNEFHFAKQGMPAAYQIQFGSQPMDTQDFIKRMGIAKEIRKTGANCAETFQSANTIDVGWWNLKNVQSCSIGFYKSERLYYTILIDETSNNYWNVYIQII